MSLSKEVLDLAINAGLVTINLPPPPVQKFTKKNPPTCFSDAIDMAVDDLESVLRSKKYTVNMAAWHTPQNWTTERKCAVCFAGSVMAKSLRRQSGDTIDPSDFDEPWRSILLALNDLRCGEVADALSSWMDGFKLVPDIKNGQTSWDLAREFNCDVASFDGDGAEFIRDMRALAAILRKAGT